MEKVGTQRATETLGIILSSQLLAPRRMLTILKNAISEYKQVYDELVKFEQDNCTVEAASVPRLKTH